MNGKYSLRAYARDLGLSASRLTEVFSKKSGLSKTSATRITEKLGLSLTDARWFCDHVSVSHGRSAAERETAKQRIGKNSLNRDPKKLTADQVNYISSWQCLTLLELVSTDGFHDDFTWMSRRLSITANEVKKHFSILRRLKLIRQQDGKWLPDGSFRVTSSQIPSRAIRKCHGSLIEKAKWSVLHETVDERDVSAIVFPVAFTDLPWIKEELKEFRRALYEKIKNSTSPKDEVYCLNIQYFPLTKKESSG